MDRKKIKISLGLLSSELDNIIDTALSASTRVKELNKRVKKGSFLVNLMKNVVVPLAVYSALKKKAASKDATQR